MSDSKANALVNSTVPSAGRANEAGKISRDDRGTVSWQWSDDENLQADNTLGAVERMRALDNPTLDVLDDDEDHNPVKHTSKALKRGYNPYNSGALGKDSHKKKMNLRELSKWIELKRKVDYKKVDDK